MYKMYLYHPSRTRLMQPQLRSRRDTYKLQSAFRNHHTYLALRTCRRCEKRMDGEKKKTKERRTDISLDCSLLQVHTSLARLAVIYTDMLP